MTLAAEREASAGRAVAGAVAVAELSEGVEMVEGPVAEVGLVGPWQAA